MLGRSVAKSYSPVVPDLLLHSTRCRQRGSYFGFPLVDERGPFLPEFLDLLDVLEKV